MKGRNNNNLLSNLPVVLVNLILEYSNIIIYRNGKYINRIYNSDIRYDLIKKIPRPIKINNNQYYIGLSEKGRKVIKIYITYTIYEKNISIITSENHVGRNGLIYTTKDKDNVFI